MTDQNIISSSQFSSKLSSGKHFNVAYDPENNKNNIFARKVTQPIPKTRDQFAGNPFTKIMQPQDVTKSKRFTRDKLNISDIQGTQPDPYKLGRRFDGRDYLEVNDIEGAKPTQLKQSKEPTHQDYKLYAKDINNAGKWHSKRIVDPLNPQYIITTKSKRKQIIGQVEKSQPKQHISPETRRFANYVDDIEGAKAKKSMAISEDQRLKMIPENTNSSKFRMMATRNENSLYNNNSINNTNANNTSILSSGGVGNLGNAGLYNNLNNSQIDSLNQSALLPIGGRNEQQKPPASHYARFQSNYTTNTNVVGNNRFSGQQDNEHSPLRGVFDNNRDLGQVPKSNHQLMQNYHPAFHTKTNSTTVDDKRYQVPKFHQLESNMNSVSSKRVQKGAYGSYLLDQVNQSIDVISPSNILQYQNQPIGLAQNHHTNSQEISQNVSPLIQNRVWSKAREVGKEIVNNMGTSLQMNNSNIGVGNIGSVTVDVRLNKNMSPIVQSLNNANNETSKRNFEQNMYDRGVKLNSGHGSTSLVFGSSSNPINNEIHIKNYEALKSQMINKHAPGGNPHGSVSLNGSILSHRRDPKQQGTINPITQLIDNPSVESLQDYNNGDKNWIINNSSNAVKQVVPSTTQKAYGNFLDSKQIDDLISQLKKQNGAQKNSIF